MGCGQSSETHYSGNTELPRRVNTSDRHQSKAFDPTKQASKRASKGGQRLHASAGTSASGGDRSGRSHTTKGRAEGIELQSMSGAIATEGQYNLQGSWQDDTYAPYASSSTATPWGPVAISSERAGLQQRLAEGDFEEQLRPYNFSPANALHFSGTESMHENMEFTHPEHSKKDNRTSSDLVHEPLDVIEVGIYQIERAQRNVLRRKGDEWWSRHHTGLKDVSTRWEESLKSLNLTKTGKKSARSVEEVLQRSWNDVLQTSTGLSSEEIILLNHLREEQERPPLKLPREQIPSFKVEARKEEFKEYFSKIDIKPDAKAPYVIVARFCKEGDVIAFHTNFNTKTRTIHMIDAYKDVDDNFYLSEIILQQIQMAKEKKFRLPLFKAVTVDVVDEADTTAAMEVCGVGTFEENTEQFNLLQESNLMKSIRHLHNDDRRIHKENNRIFEGEKLVRIKVSSDLGTITAEFA